MAKSLETKVFLDANVVIAAGKPPGGPVIRRVRDLVKARLITILTTDLTISEIAKKHAFNDYNVIREIGRGHFRKLCIEYAGVKMPDISKAELKERIDHAYVQSVGKMFKEIEAKMLSIDSVKPSSVFASYTAGEGFFSGEGKKDQFSDAFIFECLKLEASVRTPVIVVSSDGDFTKPVEQQPHISLTNSVPELFRILGLQVEAPELEEFLEDSKDDLLDLVNLEVFEWGLEGDVEDAEIQETEVTQVVVEEITSFGSIEKGGQILVIARLLVTADISYKHPDWDNASYDSEDKVLIPMSDVSGETEVNFLLDVSMTIAVDEDDEPSSIIELKIRNNDALYVTLHPYDEYD